MSNNFLVDDSRRKIELENDQWVEVKQDISYKELSAILKENAKLSQESEQEAIVNSMLIAIPLLKLVLVDWSFTNDDGSKIPCTHENIEKLKTQVTNQILVHVRLKDYLSFNEAEKKSS